MLHQALAWFALPVLPRWLHDLGTLRTFAARAAQAYFAAWAGYALRWRTSDRRRMPLHWLVIRERMSPLSNNARHAVDPCNAELNYAYGCLESQCWQALAVEAFDPACGFLHTDKAGRDSLVLDLMELYRPAVDGRVLTLLEDTTFTYGDLVMTSAGQCRLHPQITRAVVAACRLPSDTVTAGAVELHALLIEGERVSCGTDPRPIAAHPADHNSLSPTAAIACEC